MKHHKRLLAGAISIVLSCSGLLAGAMSAGAAITPPQIWLTGNCGTSGPDVRSAASGGTGVSSVTYTSPSDQLVVTNSCTPSTPVTVQSLIGATVAGSFSLGNSPPTTNLALDPDLTSLRFVSAGGTANVTLIYSGGGGGTSSSSSSASTPGPVFQQFGRPASGTCASAASESLNWSGVANDGWGESWAQWMNGGNGGAVCTRTLVYSTAQSRWVIG